jgi:hypothetical protein
MTEALFRRRTIAVLLTTFATVGAITADTTATASPGGLTWTTQPPLPTARGGLASAVLGGRIYVLGGLTSGEAKTLGSVQAFDPGRGDGALWPRCRPLAASSGQRASTEGSTRSAAETGRGRDRRQRLLGPRLRTPARRHRHHAAHTRQDTHRRQPRPRARARLHPTGDRERLLQPQTADATRAPPRPHTRGLALRIAQRILTLTLGILLNTLNGRPARALAAYDGR